MQFGCSNQRWIGGTEFLNAMTCDVVLVLNPPVVNWMLWFFEWSDELLCSGSVGTSSGWMKCDFLIEVTCAMSWVLKPAVLVHWLLYIRWWCSEWSDLCHSVERVLEQVVIFWMNLLVPWLASVANEQVEHFWMERLVRIQIECLNSQWWIECTDVNKVVCHDVVAEASDEWMSIQWLSEWKQCASEGCDWPAWVILSAGQLLRICFNRTYV